MSIKTGGEMVKSQFPTKLIPRPEIHADRTSAAVGVGESDALT